MNSLFAGPLAQAIGWALLHLLWQATVVGGILAAVLSLLRQRSANARYAAACAALAILPLLVIATAWRCYEPLPASIGASLELRDETLPIDLAKAAVVHATKTTIYSAGDLAHRALPYVVLIWLAGVTLLTIRLFVSWSRVQRLAATGTPAGSRWHSTLVTISAALDLRSAVTLLESAAIEVPTVVGWLRPAILLPASTLSGLTPDQVEMLLAHELAHIRRNDFFVNVLQSAVETLLFYHPAVWWISNRIRVEREHCCDDLAVSVNGNAVQYARALTRLEELRARRTGLAVAANGGSLVARVRRLIGVPDDPASSATRWLAGIGVLAIVITILAVPTLPLRAEKEKTPPPVKKQSKATATPVSASTSKVDVTAPHDPYDEAEADAETDTETDVDVDSDSYSSDDVETDSEVPDVPEPPGAPGFPVVTPAAPPAPAGVPVPVIAVAPRVAARAAVIPAIAPMMRDAMRDAVHAGVEGALAGSRSRHQFGASGKLTVDELIVLRESGVTPEYINEMRAAGITGDLGDFVAMREQGVDAAYIRNMHAAGVDAKNIGELIALRNQGVTPDYVKQMSDAGYRNLSTRELIELRTMGVSPAFVKALADAGYTNLSARDLVRLAAQGVSPEFIREISKYRDKK